MDGTLTSDRANLMTVGKKAATSTVSGRHVSSDAWVVHEA